MRTARSRTSLGYLLVVSMTPSSQRLELPVNPGRFNISKTAFFVNSVNKTRTLREGREKGVRRGRKAFIGYLLLPSSACLSQSIFCSKAWTRMPIIQLRGASTPCSSARSVTAKLRVLISV